MKNIFSALIFVFTLISSSASYARVGININNEEIPKIKILFYGFDAASPQIKNDAEIILNRISKNLQTTDLFEILKKSGSAELLAVTNPESSSDQIPDFNKYNALGIGALLIGDAEFDSAGNLQLKVRLWDILDERQLFGKFYSAPKDSYKKMANLISDEIFKSVTKEKSGHFDSKITYVAESGNIYNRVKKIALMDFDGENRHYLTNGKDLVLTPVFAKKAEEIMFLRYFNNKAQIYSLNIKNSNLRKISGFNGTTLAPSINPKNPDLILFSVIDDGNSNIYEMSLSSNIVTKLTGTTAINTTPCYSPDGKSIVFASDRSGSQEIYIMDSDGSNVRKISHNKGDYSKPVWSPDGSLIAFTRINSNKFGIGLMTPDGRNEKIISSGYVVEGAKWSPNGRYLIYSRKNGAYGKESIPRLYTIDILTGFEREVPTPPNEGAIDPDWVLN